MEELNSAFAEAQQERDSASSTMEELRARGSIIVLEGANADYPLRLDSLSRLTTHRNTPKLPKWLLLSVRPATGDTPESATVWVSDEYRAEFLRLFENYLDEAKNSKGGNSENWTTPEGNPANQELVANIAKIRNVALRDLWTSDGEPPRGWCWWELWLDSSRLDLDLLEQYLSARELRMQARSTALPGRTLVWVEAEWADLGGLLSTRVPLAEIRRPGFIDTFEDLSVGEQDEYILDLEGRIEPASRDAPTVCHLDTGVRRTHRLLRGSLAADDHHTIVDAISDDTAGHGTRMAGLALFGGALAQLFLSNTYVRLAHRLESVRIMAGNSNPSGDPCDFGTATAQAVSLPEVTAPRRRRVFCLPVTRGPDIKPGEPTLWSAIVDALAAGTEVTRDGDQLKLLSAPDPNAARLILIAAGNVGEYQSDYRVQSDISAIHDPAQAWNALTVGGRFRGWKHLCW